MNRLIDGLIGFAQGVAKDYTQLSAMVRFNPSGRIDARNGGAFSSSATIPYVAQ